MTGRKSARWMCTLDERILEHLAETCWSSPRLISREMDFNASRSRVAERCHMLAYAGLIAPSTKRRRMYEITGDGQRYLEGRLDVENKPRPSPRVIRNY